MGLGEGWMAGVVVVEVSRPGGLINNVLLP